MAPVSPSISENLYHLLLSTSHMSKNPNNLVETIRIPGTYTSLHAAKNAAHSCLYDAGYEKDFFAEYQTKPEVFEAQDLPERQGLAVFAVAGDGTTFRVRIDTTPNTQQLTTDNPDGRISQSIYYVVESIAKFDGASGSPTVIDVSVQGLFPDYQKAREYGMQSLLSKDSNVQQNFEDYYKAASQEEDCDYGENVIVHATGRYGENLLISIIQGQELANVALTEAATRID